MGEPKNVPFWMDTLWLPQDTLELRRRSVLRILEAFKRASKVLVLDAYFGKVSTEDMAPTEIIARVSICPWTQKLWTFAEGLLAKHISMQFRDRAFDVMELDTYRRQESEYFSPTLSRQIF